MSDPDTLLASGLERTRDALASGDLDRATAICAELLARYPAHPAVWGLRGDVERVRDDTREAGRAYAAALARDPRLADAWLGLGLLAERHGRLDDALAYCQVAWEVAPERADLREMLERLAILRHGPGGALELSRPALAALHLRAGRPERAAREYVAALAQLPERIDLRLGLAESLWRMGHDEDAASICAEVLETRPQAVIALLILADVERRRGAVGLAEDLATRLRAIDPDVARVAASVVISPPVALVWPGEHR